MRLWRLRRCDPKSHDFDYMLFLQIMNNRFFQTTALILTAGMVISDSGMSGTVGAAITTIRDSADFNLKSWEGDSVPAPANGSLTDWSVDGNGNYVAVMTDVEGALGGNGLASGTTGWTVETRLKIDPNNLPSAKAIEFQFGDDTTNPHWVLAAIGNVGDNYQVWETGNLNAPQWTGGSVGEFMTFRVAVEGGNGDVRWYANGTDIGTIPGLEADLNRQWLGDMGGLVSDGTVVVDYFRMDTTGAYAPPAAPDSFRADPSLAPGFAGRKAAWVDYNNDGHVDILSDWKLWRNNGGSSFTHVADLPEGVWADFDNDGRLDLYSYEYNYMYRNLSTSTTTNFAEVNIPAVPPAVHPIGSDSRGASWADYDNDGYVDLYVGGYEIFGETPAYFDAVLRNNQGMSFTSSSSDYYNFSPARGVTSADFDQDGDQDVYVSNYRLVANRLFENDGSGTFTNVAGSLNAEATSQGFAGGHSIGSVWGDFDNDGLFDLFAGNFAHSGQPESRFLRNRGPEAGYAFEDMGTGGVSYQESYASPAVGDYDNDGDLDLLFTTAPGYGDSPRLYRNDGNWSFENVTDAAGLDSLGDTYQAAWGDFDNDGDLDLASGATIWVNSGNSNHWLKVHLEAAAGSGVNRAAIGAEVRINLGDNTMTRQVEGGTGEGNQNDTTLHFGFGDYNGPVELEIRAPGGEVWDVIGVATLDQTVSYEISFEPILQWAVDGLGDWNSDASWIGAGSTPDSNAEFAVFGSVITAPHTVLTDAAVTVKGITFDNANTYVIAGAGSVTLASDNNTSTVSVLQGDHQFQAVVNLSNATDVDVAASSSLAFNNVLNLGGNTLTKLGEGTLNINNDLNTGGGSVVVVEGVLSGGGTVGGDLTNDGGTLSPGNSPGVLEITGDYAQGSDARLLLEIGGTDPGNEFDVLQVGGTADLAGELAVVLIEDYQPILGDSFAILDFGSLSPDTPGFDTVILPALDGGLAWDDSALYSSGSLSVVAVPEPEEVGLLVVICFGLALVGRRDEYTDTP